MQSKAMQSKILLKMQSEAKQSIAQQSNAKQFKAMQSTAQAQHKQSKSKAKAMFRELQRASESFRELQRAPIGDIEKLIQGFNFSKIFLSSCKPFQSCHTSAKQSNAKQNNS